MFISITACLRMFACGNIIDMDPRNFIVMWVEIFIFTCIFYLNNIYFKIYLTNVWYQIEKNPDALKCWLLTLKKEF